MYPAANFPDPYCILCVGEQYKKTDVRKSTLNPLWNQYFDFEVYEHEKRKVYLQVMDFNKLQNDEFMGRESIDFSDLLEFPVRACPLKLNQWSMMIHNKICFT
jgi:Ca2+-dependent lipid-binding protein